MDTVGKYKEEFNKQLNINLPINDIYQSDGLIIHIKKRHPGLEKYMSDIPDIIKNPDYIGVNPKETDSIELIKILDDNILVAVKLDKNANHLFVASLYNISNSKLVCNYTTNALYTSYCVALQSDGSNISENNTLNIADCEFLYNGVNNYGHSIYNYADLGNNNTVTVLNCTNGTGVTEKN